MLEHNLAQLSLSSHSPRISTRSASRTSLPKPRCLIEAASLRSNSLFLVKLTDFHKEKPETLNFAQFSSFSQIEFYFSPQLCNFSNEPFARVFSSENSNSAYYVPSNNVDEARLLVFNSIPGLFKSKSPGKRLKLLFTDGLVHDLKDFSVNFTEDFYSTVSFTPLLHSSPQTVTINQTDGLGSISSEFAQELSATTSEIPGAFQFRYQGSKGVLVVDKSLNGRQIILRPSQIKFANSDLLNGLLIIKRFSSVETGRLNEMLILLLLQLELKTFLLNMIKRNFSLLSKLKICRNNFYKQDSKGAKLSMKLDCLHWSMAVVDVNWTATERLASLKLSSKSIDSFNLNCSSLKIVNSYLVGFALVYRYPVLHTSDALLLRFVERSDSPLDAICLPLQSENVVPTMFHLSGGDFDGDSLYFLHDADLVENLQSKVLDNGEFSPSFLFSTSLSSQLPLEPVIEPTVSAISELEFSERNDFLVANIYMRVLRQGALTCPQLVKNYYDALDGEEVEEYVISQASDNSYAELAKIKNIIDELFSSLEYLIVYVTKLTRKSQTVAAMMTFNMSGKVVSQTAELLLETDLTKDADVYALLLGLRVGQFSNSKLLILSPSEYVKNATQNYLNRWNHNNWRNQKGQPVRNSGIWKAVHETFNRDLHKFFDQNSLFYDDGQFNELRNFAARFLPE
ncbi:hypothetical protein RCL1_008303 [Eukaryota sp. TZLM3-RCL]